MGAIFSRIGSEPYYASYERSFERLKEESDRLQESISARQVKTSTLDSYVFWYGAAGFVVVLARAAWVLRQPSGSYTARQHALGVAPLFLEPLAVYLLYRLLHLFLDWRLRQEERSRRAIDKKLRAMVTELKDSTRYEKTQQLLEKYDPDWVPASPPGTRLRMMATPRRQKQPFTPSGPAPGTPRTGGGHLQRGLYGHLLPALDNLAQKFVGDDPVLVNGLQEAKREAEAVRQRLAAAEERAAQLQRENDRLRALLGEAPAGAEEADEDAATPPAPVFEDSSIDEAGTGPARAGDAASAEAGGTADVSEAAAKEASASEAAQKAEPEIDKENVPLHSDAG